MAGRFTSMAALAVAVSVTASGCGGSGGAEKINKTHANLVCRQVDVVEEFGLNDDLSQGALSLIISDAPKVRSAEFSNIAARIDGAHNEAAQRSAVGGALNWCVDHHFTKN